MTWVVLMSALGLMAPNERVLAASPSEVQAALLDAGQPAQAWHIEPSPDGSGGTLVRYEAIIGRLPSPRTVAALQAALALQARFDDVAARLTSRRAQASGFNMGGTRPRRMANCPSAVAGARTAISDAPGGVDVIVTATGGDARDEIRRRAERQVEATQIFTRGGEEHSGIGNGPGRFGFCPGIAPETALSAVAVPGGVRLRVRAYRSSSIPILRKITHDRANALAGRS